MSSTKKSGSSSPITLGGLTAASIVPFVAAYPRVADAVVSDNTSYCAVQRLFGVQCPVCGLTHAMIDLVHGSFIEATRSNALIWLYLGLVIVGWLSVAGIRVPVRRSLQANFGWMLLGTIATFSVVRNL